MVISVDDSAVSLDFEIVDHFEACEFPGDSLQFIEAELVLALSEYRERLGYPVVPSPVLAGWYRFGGSVISRHYVGPDSGEVERLSDAGDVFPKVDIRKALLVALGCEWWGGVGVYLDTDGPSGKPEPMLHLDLRPGRRLWMRYKGRYIYPLRSSRELAEFFARLDEFG